MIISRFAIVIEDLVICCYQVTKICSSRYGFPIASSAWCPFNLGPFLQISQFRSLGKWVWTLCLPKSSHLFVVGSKEVPWEELTWEPPCIGISSSTKFSLNSCSRSGISESPHGFLRSIVVFDLFLGFCWLGFPQVPWSIIIQIRHWHWRNVTVRCIFPFSNMNFAKCRWRRWGWRRWRRRMTLLFHG